VRLTLYPDKDGIAVILCETELESKYRTLVQGKTVLESSLHLNLAEHINSEIGLGTITDLASAKTWLHNSFLYQRMNRNPQHYTLNGLAATDGDELIMRSIEQLKVTQLVEEVENSMQSKKLCSTEYGEIMSKANHQSYPYATDILTRFSVLHSACDSRSLWSSARAVVNLS